MAIACPVRDRGRDGVHLIVSEQEIAPCMRDSFGMEVFYQLYRDDKIKQLQEFPEVCTYIPTVITVDYQ